MAEDEPIIRSLIGHSLQSQGYQVLLAANGVEAMSEAARHSEGDIDLLITDIVMPQMGGVELARQLRETWPSIRILSTSGYSDLVNTQELTAFGGEYLQKPLLPSALVLKVGQVLDKA